MPVTGMVPEELLSPHHVIAHHGGCATHRGGAHHGHRGLEGNRKASHLFQLCVFEDVWYVRTVVYV